MTIGYNRLGSNGRLGNQMFQYAGLRGIAEHKNYQWVIPEPVSYGDSNYGLFDCFEMGSVTEENFGYINGNNVSTGCFHFDKDFFDNCPDNVNLHDYFQTEKYFENVSNTLRSDFTFKREIVDSCSEIISEVSKPIFLHIRRGDYVKHSHSHPLCPISYYQKSLEHFDKDSNVLILSDDPEWCKEQKLFDDDRFMISEFNIFYEHTADTNDGRMKSLVPYYDLCLMSMCEGGIIANSSLSWWGAWLIKDPKQSIIAPSLWFGEMYKHYNMSDLIPSRWIIQDV